MLLLVGTAFGQSKKDLEKKKTKLKKEITYTNKLLNKTRQKKNATLTELVQLNRKIESRQALVGTIKSEVGLLKKDIDAEKQKIVELETELKQLKADYARMIYTAYKNRSGYNKLMFVFTAEDFNQAYLRMKYLQQYADSRKKQADLIEETRLAITERIEQIEHKIGTKKELIGEQVKEQGKLSEEKKEQEVVVSKLQQQEDKLRADIRKKQKARQKLQAAINKIIAEEIRLANAKKNTTKTKKGFPLTPEAMKLSKSFASNKGRLPWPVSQGVITGKFGKHAHPVLRDVILDSKGVDISTSANSYARAVFDGEVSRVVIIPGEGKAVFVRHGEYLSVYTYMSDVMVQKGDKVSTKDNIGKLVSSDKSKATVHLEIWKGTVALNPEYWLYRH